MLFAMLRKSFTNSYLTMKRLTIISLAALAAAGATATTAAVVQHRKALKGEQHASIENNDFTPKDRPAKAVKPAKATAIYALPFSIFDNQDATEAQASFKQCTVINANGDKDKHDRDVTWFYANYGASSVGEPEYADDKQNDDWFILPGVQFADGSINYELKVDHGCNIRNMASDFEFYIGNAPTVEAMKTKIGESLDFKVSTTGTPVEESFTFALPEGKTGTYYIAVRDVTKADGRVLFSSWFRNFRIAATEGNASMASQISDAIITPGENGALNATMKFNLPSTDMTGKAIPANKTITATINCNDWSSSVSGAPGAAQTVAVTTKQGDNTITIRADVDGIEGEPFSYNVYTGEVIADRVQGLEAEVSEDNLSYSLTWDAPLGGLDGGYVDMSRIRYDIYRLLGDEDEKTLLTTTTETSYTYTVPAGTKLASTSIYVLPRTDAGVSTDEWNYVYDDNDVYKTAVIGQPYVIPAKETLPGGQLTLTPLRREVPDGYRGKWNVTLNDILEGGNEWCIYGFSPYFDYEEDVETMGRLGLPKISTEGLHNAAINLKVYKNSTDCKKMQVLAKAYGIDAEVVADVDVKAETPEWGDYSFILPEKFQNKKWVQLYVDVDYTDPKSFYIIDSYGFSNAAGNDLAVTDISAPAVLSVGEEGAISATIYNQGVSSLTPKGRFQALLDGNIVSQSDEITLAETATNTNATFHWTYTPAIQAKGKDLAIRFELTSQDDVAANNSAQANIKVVDAEVPVVDNLVGVYDEDADNNVTLIWSEPDLTKPMTESFEDVEAFYYGDTYGVFTAVDGDGKEVFRFSDNEMPNQELPKAWLTVDDTQIPNAQGLEAYTGHKYLMAVSPYADANVKAVAADDWLISSEVKPGSRISFWAKIINESYPESFRVMYSTTNADVKSFKVLDTQVLSRNGWKQFAYVLPSDAKYFAINYVSSDKFALIIDDVRHSPLLSQYQISGYNVYRNNQKVATTTENTWKDANHKATDSYTVRAIVDGKEMPESNVATLVPSGIESISTEASCAEYYTPSGVKVSAADLTPGLYIQVVGGKSRKVIVK